MRRSFGLGLLLVLLTAAGSWTGEVRLSFFQVNAEQNDFVVSWQSDVEQEVQAYELQRRTRYTNGEFNLVATVAPHGTGQPYRYVDDQVFKSAAEQVDYRVEVVYENGLRQVLASKSVNYTPTAVRRTWGSIKAMWQ